MSASFSILWHITCLFWPIRLTWESPGGATPCSSQCMAWGVCLIQSWAGHQARSGSKILLQESPC
jgi:hypothetical protein